MINNNKVVKTVRFKDEKYVGDPINTVKIFNEKEVDEIVILDISASKTKSAPDLDKIYNIVGEAFMPVGYGGGISTIEQIKEILFRGVEKVVINTGAFNNLSLIEEGARLFGSSSIVVSIDTKKSFFGKTKVYSHVKDTSTKLSVVEFARQAENAGAGEIFLNSVDQDGTFGGYDIATIRSVSENVSVPVIACGGASSIQDFYQAIVGGKASAVAAGSFFVFQRPHRAVLISYPSQDKLEKEIFEKITE